MTINSMKASSIVLFFLLVAFRGLTTAVPIEQNNSDQSAFVNQSNVSNTSIVHNETIVATSTKPEFSETSDNSTLFNANATDDGQEPFVGTVGAVVAPDQLASASGFDPALYANLLTPDTFQQYVNQFGAAYAPYAAAAAAAYAPGPGSVYPAPAVSGYPSAGSYPATGSHYPYPLGPYVVQTGYEGYLVPTTTTTSTAATTGATSSTDSSSTTTTTPATSLMRPGFIANLFSALMMSTVFRVIATVLSTIAVVLFGNAVAGALCRFTPICDIPSQTVTYLRGRGAEDVGRMLTEGVTPERVRRAAEFVRNAIKKYHALKQLINDDNANDEQNRQQQEY